MGKTQTPFGFRRKSFKLGVGSPTSPYRLKLTGSFPDRSRELSVTPHSACHLTRLLGTSVSLSLHNITQITL